MSISDTYRILAEDYKMLWCLPGGGTQMLTQVLDLFLQFATIGGGLIIAAAQLFKAIAL